MSPDQEITEITRALSSPLPPIAVAAMLRGLESSAATREGRAVVRSVASAVHSAVHPETGEWDLGRLGVIIQAWLASHGILFDMPQRTNYPANRQAVPEFPEPEMSTCGSCGESIYRMDEQREWGHEDSRLDSQHIPFPMSAETSDA